MAGNATGELITGRKRRRIIEAASNGLTVNKVAEAAKTTWRTADAVIKAESETIAERKRKLTDLYAEIAQRGAERLLDGIDKAPYGSLIPISGMATDKLLALTASPESQIANHLHLHATPSNLMEQFNTLIASLPVNHSLPVASPAEKQVNAKEIEADNAQSSVIPPTDTA